MPGIIMEQSTQQVTALYAARVERGWSVAEAAERVREAGLVVGVSLPYHLCKLADYVRLWESGKQRPSERYGRVLVAAYGRSAEELGLPAQRVGPFDGPEVRERMAVLFSRYHRSVVAYIADRVRDGALAEDLASETFVRVAGRLHSVKSPDDRMMGWLRCQARDVIYGHYQRLSATRETVGGDLSGGEGPTGAGTVGAVACLAQLGEAPPLWSVPGPTAEERLIDEECVLELLSGLCDRQRRILWHRFVLRLSPQETGQRLGIPAWTVTQEAAEGLALLNRQVTGETVTPDRYLAPQGDWVEQAREAVEREAATGRTFTRLDLPERQGIVPPASSQRWSKVLDGMRRRGVIRKVGMVRVSCEGGPTRPVTVWAGACGPAPSDASAVPARVLETTA